MRRTDLRVQLSERTAQERADLDHYVLEMRGRELSYRAIATVLDLYEGLEVSEIQVRAWLVRLGAPPIPRFACRPQQFGSRVAA